MIVQVILFIRKFGFLENYLWYESKSTSQFQWCVLLKTKLDVSVGIVIVTNTWQKYDSFWFYCTCTNTVPYLPLWRIIFWYQNICTKIYFVLKKEEGFTIFKFDSNIYLRTVRISLYKIYGFKHMYGEIGIIQYEVHNTYAH